MKPIVCVDRIGKRYGRRCAVADVSFDLEPGEVLALLGPNGAGKTTVLRMLAGYLRPSAGTARIAGFDVVTDGLETRRRVGYVPEDAALYPQMRVEEFLGFMARIKGVNGAAVDAVTARFALGSVRRLTIDKLSRGFRQRVAIAQAVLTDPALLILDEPTTGLDPLQINDIRELIRALGPGRATIVASHILGEVAQIATRVAVLLDGRLRALRSLGDEQRPLVRLRVRAATRAALEAVVRAVPGFARLVSTTAASGNVWTIAVELEEAAATEHLAAAITAAGFGLLEMTETRPNLEGLFLEATRQATP